MKANTIINKKTLNTICLNTIRLGGKGGSTPVDPTYFVLGRSVLGGKDRLA